MTASDETGPASPTAIVLLTGSELVRGETRDENGAYLGRQLTLLGVRVREVLVIPDDPAFIRDEIRRAVESADVVVSSGGLGPTADDHVVAAAAEALGRGVVRDEEAAARMERRVRERLGPDHRLPSNFFHQADVVEGAEVLQNPVGLAPGIVVDTKRGFLAILPGVPREFRALVEREVLPRVRDRFELEPPRVFRAKLIGEKESWAEEKLQGLGLDLERLEYGITAKPGDLTIKLIAHRPKDYPLVDDAKECLAAAFGDAFVPLPEGLDATTTEMPGRAASLTLHSRVVHEALLAAKKKLATAESCTGGLIAAELTHHAGSSEYLLGGIVSYANEVKAGALGVAEKLLEEHGAVSEPVCRAMVTGALTKLGADIAVATTGIAGPGGGSAEKPVGLVYIGAGTVEGAGEPAITVARHEFYGDRDAVRRQAALHALEMVRRLVVRGENENHGR